MKINPISLLSFAICTASFWGPEAVADEYTEEVTQRCFAYESETHSASVILLLGQYLVEGAEFGTVNAASGESWGYRTDVDGEVEGNRLDLSVSTLVEGDFQFTQEVWEIDGDLLKTDRGEFVETACAPPLRDRYFEADASASEPVAPPLAEPGEAAELCFSRTRDSASATARLHIAQGGVTGGVFGQFSPAAGQTQMFWTAVRGTAENDVLTVDLFTVINGETIASSEVWTVGADELSTPTETLLAVQCGAVREEYLARQPADIPVPANLDVGALVAEFQTEVLDFAANVAGCTPFDQDYRAIPNNTTLNRAVEGPEAGLCVIRFQAIDPQGRVTRCRLSADETAIFAAGWRELANNIRPDGSYKRSYPADTPDGVRNIMTSQACTVEPR